MTMSVSFIGDEWVVTVESVWSCCKIIVFMMMVMVTCGVQICPCCSNMPIALSKQQNEQSQHHWRIF